MTLGITDALWCQWTDPIIKFSMMIRTNADDVFNSIRSVMWFAEWADVVCLRIPRTVWQNDGVSTKLAFVVVKSFDLSS